jgi:hypothetical protein
VWGNAGGARRTQLLLFQRILGILALIELLQAPLLKGLQFRHRVTTLKLLEEDKNIHDDLALVFFPFAHRGSTGSSPKSSQAS